MVVKKINIKLVQLLIVYGIENNVTLELNVKGKDGLYSIDIARKNKNQMLINSITSFAKKVNILN